MAVTFELIPRPKSLRRGAGEAAIGALQVGPLPAALAELEPAIAALAGSVARLAPGAPAATIAFAADAGLGAEGHTIAIAGRRIEVAAATSRGALLAVRTLVDLLDQTAPLLPELAIADRPDRARRGLFVESFAGIDRMGRDEYAELLDRLAQLKLNTVAFSLHGCWDLRHDGDRCEFVMAPLPGHPGLRTPQRLRTWDPARGEEVVLEALPRMFAEDLWGEVVAHGRSVGIDLLPVWGGPAHSSLVPRAVPALSARNADGTAKGYGHCVTGEEARAAIRGLMRELALTHLVPHGIDRLGCGGDEFYPIVNVRPEAPLEPVAPTCDCAGCRDLSPGAQLVEYLVLAGRELADHGVGMWVYHDSLEREGVWELLRERAAQEGLEEPGVAWWGYTDPVPAISTPGARSWAMPTTGPISGLFLQDHGDNVEAWAAEADRVGAEGIVAYAMPEPAHHKSIACLADLAWNWRGSGGVRGFGERWARRVAADPAQAGAVLAAYDHGERVIGSQPLMMYLLNHLLPYFSTSPGGVHVYPDDAVRAISAPIPALASLLRQTAATVRIAAERLPATRPTPAWPDPGPLWRAELRRLAAHVELIYDAADLARRLHREPLAALEEEVAALEARGRELLELVAASKPAHLAPAALREHWLLVGQLRPMLERMEAEPAARPSARAAWHAWML